MRLNEILSAAGANKKRLRVGRGEGSGRGKTSGRGTKGGGARAGHHMRYGHEGGQNAILKRIPKRGFNNFNFTIEYQVVNVGDLDVFADGEQVTIAALAAKHMVHTGGGPVKILGTGDVKKKLTVVANAFSASATKKIVDAGGQAQRA
jgi:large subunit ribosomal protein L15